MDYKSIMQREVQAARAIASKAEAENRDLTPEEIGQAQTHLKAYESAKAADREASTRGGRNFTTETAQKLANIGFGGFEGSGDAASMSRGFKSVAGSRWSRKAAEIFQKVMAGPDGSKALTSGSIDVPSVIAEPVEITGRPLSVLDLVPKRKNTDKGRGNAFSYLRQTARTNNAGAVADNATKPTSIYTFGDVEDAFRVYAHLSEVFPKRYLDDYNGLIQILQNQMGAGLMEALEEDILNGAIQPQDGFTGVLNTSGIQTQAWATDLLTTMSNAKYKLVNTHESPNAWVLNPNDVQRLELIREDGATGPFMFRNGIADVEKFVGAPIVPSTAITAGVGLLGDWEQTELIIREDDHLDIDTSGAKFEKNQVQFRLEGRYGFTIERPMAFVSVDLTA
ncbi:phage major capsid protein [Microbacterium sp. NEAU-LLC]|uniref:Phage major capsid protein n=1 Tax=Microbacterium helvum TaxID=2773713 RepID=A0ABR8NQU7_9MICO|nr:phage major capsid protein [Microbacterium helvum]MBD3942812.1 phage major capsid protein [Microbacterium helvum]